MGKQFSEDLKLKAVNYYNQINNYVQTCEIFDYSELICLMKHEQLKESRVHIN